MFGEILLILGLILLNGLFSLSEMAIVSSRKARLRHEADSGKEAYRLALEAADQPGRYLSAIQVSITLIGILTGAVGGATISRSLTAWLSSFHFLAKAAAPLSVAIVVVLSTFLSVVIGELVPKSLALARPERIAAAVIRPLRALTIVFDPIVRLLSWATALVLRLFRTSEARDPEVTEEEVKVLIAQGAKTGVFERSEREMVEGVLDLDDRRVTAYMTPRTEVLTIDLGESEASVRQELLAHADYACIPVIEGDLDKVAGMLPVRAALAALVRDQRWELSEHLVQPVLIPETISALKALSIMRDKATRTALIVDEYGGVAGLVTLGDLLGQVLSGLDSGSDDEIPGVIQREDGSFLVDGALGIAQFVDSMDIDESAIEVNAYDTVAGLVLDCMGSIPKPGESCDWNGLHIEIVDMDGHRIDKVLVSRPVVNVEMEQENYD
ncbi:MAG: hemolysin family protein [Spirochaetes bacterium]|nr:hemolysin family protein [Spirochaetota bacterium]